MGTDRETEREGEAERGARDRERERQRQRQREIQTDTEREQQCARSIRRWHTITIMSTIEIMSTIRDEFYCPQSVCVLRPRPCPCLASAAALRDQAGPAYHFAAGAPAPPNKCLCVE